MLVGTAVLSNFMRAMTIHLIIRLRFSFVAFGGRSFRPFVQGLRLCGSAAKTQRSLDSLLAVERARFAFCTRVSEVFTNGLVPVVGVKAVDMLPRIARLAVDCVAIIVREVANTLDGVGLFFYRLNLLGDVIFDRRAQGQRG